MGSAVLETAYRRLKGGILPLELRTQNHRKALSPLPISHIRIVRILTQPTFAIAIRRDRAVISFRFCKSKIDNALILMARLAEKLALGYFFPKSLDPVGPNLANIRSFLRPVYVVELEVLDASAFRAFTSQFEYRLLPALVVSLTDVDPHVRVVFISIFQSTHG